MNKRKVSKKCIKSDAGYEPLEMICTVKRSGIRWDSRNYVDESLIINHLGERVKVVKSGELLKVFNLNLKIITTFQLKFTEHE